MQHNLWFMAHPWKYTRLSKNANVNIYIHFVDNKKHSVLLKENIQVVKKNISQLKQGTSTWLEK